MARRYRSDIKNTKRTKSEDFQDRSEISDVLLGGDMSIKRKKKEGNTQWKENVEIPVQSISHLILIKMRNRQTTQGTRE